MKLDARTSGTIAIAAAFLLGSFGSMLVSGFSLLDTAPTSYTIAVMMMGLLFILFTLKDRRKIDFAGQRRRILFGIAVFAVYVVALALLRVSLSWVFLTYRIDALLLPLLLASIILAVFGPDGIKVFWPAIIYIAFASPLLLLPVIGLNGALAGASAHIVYLLLRLSGAGITLSGLSIVSPSGASVMIAETCVPIGIFIAFAMFLIPVAYLYDGRTSRKVLWVASGVGLLFVLNILRMLAISLAWAFYGIGGAVSGFHSVAGGIIFYASIAAMLLIYSRYELRMPSPVKRLQPARRGKPIRIGVAAMAAAAAMGVVAFLLSLPYSGAVVASPVGFGGAMHMNSTRLDSWIGVALGTSGAGSVYLGNETGGYLFELGGTQPPANATYALVTINRMPEPGISTLNFTTVSTHSHLAGTGITVRSVAAYSSGGHYVLDYFSLPFSYNGSSESVNVEIFSETGSAAICAVQQTVGISGYVNRFESWIYNMIGRGSLAPASSCYADRIAGSV